MKKKLFIVLLTIIAAVCCAFGLSACDGFGGGGGNGGVNGGNGGGGGNGEIKDSDDHYITDIFLKDGYVVLNVGERITLYPEIYPYEASSLPLVWSSSDESVATVQNGTVYAVSAGYADITVTPKDNNPYGFKPSAQCYIEVLDPTVYVSAIDCERTLSLETGNVRTLTPTVLPANADNKNLIWSSSDESIITVSDGEITAVSAGTATITIASEDGKATATCEVTVTDPIVYVDSITLNKVSLSLNAGKSESLRATVLPENAENRSVTWQSSDKTVATVSSSGTVSAVGAGIATITVKAEDSSRITATCKVTVKDFDLTRGSNVIFYTVSGKGSLTDDELVIPSKRGDYEVTAIGDSAFENENSILSITLPESIKTIGTDAFKDCSKLTIYCEASSKPSRWADDWNCGCPVVWNCKNNDVAEDGYIYSVIDNFRYALKDGEAKLVGVISLPLQLSFPDTVTYKNSDYSLTAIGDNVFYGKTDITSITIPDSVTTIGEYAFYNCFNVNSLNLGNGLTTIGKAAFLQLSNLTSLTLPSSLTTVGIDAFGYCSALNKVYIPDLSAWCGIEFGSAYANPLYCAKNIYVNGELVTELIIPEGVTAISDYAFYGCECLQSLVLPDSVTSFGTYSFSICKNLNEVHISNIENWYGIEFKDEYANPLNGRSLYVDGELVEELIVPEGITSIGENLFYGCKITGLIIHENVTSIAESAFTSSSLVKVTMPASSISIVKAGISKSNLKHVVITGGGEIEEEAFMDYTNLTEVSISESVTSIGANAFYNCRITSASIPVWALSYFSTSYSYFRTLELTGTGEISRFISSNATNSSLQTLIIGDGITSIGIDAFYKFNSLKSVTIGKGVTSIGEFAFAYCSSLTSIEIPESVTEIGSGLFYGCSSLTSVVIPESVTSIGSRAFYGCLALNNVYISDLSSWCEIDFESDTANPTSNSRVKLYLNGELLTEAVIPEGTTKIGSYAFYCYNSLTNVTIPEGVTEIGSYAFYGCGSLTNIVIPKGVSTISNYAFYNSGALKSVVISEGVTTIGDHAFAYCSSLTSIVIPESVTSIDSYAFYSCSSLTSIVIPESVTTIGSEAFYGCSNLTIYCKASSSSRGWSSNWNGSCPVVWNCAQNDVATDGNIYTTVDGIRYALKDGEATFMAKLDKNDSDATIPQTVTYHGIDYRITAIGSYAFYNCISLTDIVIPEGVTTISDYAFYYCSSLTDIVIPESMTSIGGRAFGNCSSLKSIVIPEGVTSIGNYAFYDCSSLTGIVIPEGVTKIGDYVFYGCGSLTSIVMSQRVTEIGYCAFASCSSLTSVVIPESVTEIDSSAFSGCSSLTSIVIPDGVTTIENYAFSSCSALTSIVIPESVTEIGAKAFSECSSLTSIVISEGVTKIGSYAFDGCSSLTKIYYAGTAEEWSAVSVASYNTPLTDAARYYYSEEQPTEEGNFWHFVDGEVVEW